MDTCALRTSSGCKDTKIAFGPCERSRYAIGDSIVDVQDDGIQNVDDSKATFDLGLCEVEPLVEALEIKHENRRTLEVLSTFTRTASLTSTSDVYPVGPHAL